MKAPEDSLLTLTEAAGLLGVHYMTVYRYVRTGKLEATRNGALWQVRSQDLERLRHAPAGAAARRAETSGATALMGLEARMLAGDSPGAWQLLESRLASGLGAEDVLNDLVVPALRSIGTRWAAGELTVADEHRCTAVAQKLVGRLGLQFGRRGRRRGSVVLAAPSGDLHTLPVAIAADLLRWRGFEVIELGANTPASSVGESAAKAHSLKAVGIVATTPGQSRALRETIAAVKAAVPGTPVLVGGGAVPSARAVSRLGGDIFTGHDAQALITAVEAIAGAASH